MLRRAIEDASVGHGVDHIGHEAWSGEPHWLLSSTPVGRECVRGQASASRLLGLRPMKMEDRMAKSPAVEEGDHLVVRLRVARSTVSVLDETIVTVEVLGQRVTGRLPLLDVVKVEKG